MVSCFDTLFLSHGEIVTTLTIISAVQCLIIVIFSTMFLKLFVTMDKEQSTQIPLHYRILIVSTVMLLELSSMTRPINALLGWHYQFPQSDNWEAYLTDICNFDFETFSAILLGIGSILTSSSYIFVYLLYCSRLIIIFNGTMYIISPKTKIIMFTFGIIETVSALACVIVAIVHGIRPPFGLFLICIFITHLFASIYLISVFVKKFNQLLIQFTKNGTIKALSRQSRHGNIDISKSPNYSESSKNSKININDARIRSMSYNSPTLTSLSTRTSPNINDDTSPTMIGSDASPSVGSLGSAVNPMTPGPLNLQSSTTDDLDSNRNTATVVVGNNDPNSTQVARAKRVIDGNSENVARVRSGSRSGVGSGIGSGIGSGGCGNGNDYYHDNLVDTFIQLTILGILTCITGIFTIILLFVDIAFSDDVELRASFAVVLGIDTMVNCSCIFLQFSFTKEIYGKLCQKLHKFCRNKFDQMHTSNINKGNHVTAKKGNKNGNC